MVRDGPAGATYVKRPFASVRSDAVSDMAAPGFAVRVCTVTTAPVTGWPSTPSSRPLIGTRFPNLTFWVALWLFVTAVRTTCWRPPLGAAFVWLGTAGTGVGPLPVAPVGVV